MKHCWAVSGAFGDEAADVFQKAGTGHSEPDWYNLRLGWWSLFRHTSTIMEISIKRS